MHKLAYINDKYYRIIKPLSEEMVAHEIIDMIKNYYSADTILQSKENIFYLAQKINDANILEETKNE